MERSMKLGEITIIGAALGAKEDILDGVKLNAKSIYNVLKLKKVIMEKFATAQETSIALAKSHGAAQVESGLQVPQANLDDFNREYEELMNEPVTIYYDPIEISATSDGDTKFMEIFFDFIQIVD